MAGEAFRLVIFACGVNSVASPRVQMVRAQVRQCSIAFNVGLRSLSLGPTTISMYTNDQAKFRQVMNRSHILAQRIATFLQKQNAGYCEACLVERLSIASKAALRAALETSHLAVGIGVCPDCKVRKQIVSRRSGTMAA